MSEPLKWIKMADGWGTDGKQTADGEKVGYTIREHAFREGWWTVTRTVGGERIWPRPDPPTPRVYGRKTAQDAPTVDEAKQIAEQWEQAAD